jgi:hypothetical protein
MELIHIVAKRVIFGLVITLLTTMASAGEVATTASVDLNDRQRIYIALSDQNLLDNHRQLVRMVHVCNLIIENNTYPVIQIKEHVRGAKVPRGVQQVLILDSSLKYVNKIAHDITAAPLYCKDNKLYWFGYVMAGDHLPEGNVVTFTNGGKKTNVSAMESNDFPPQVPPQ